MENSMATQSVDNDTQIDGGRRIMMRPEMEEVEQETTGKETKRRKRYDSTLHRFVTPEERDGIRAYQARHGSGKYPPKYAAEIEAADAARGTLKTRTVGVIAKPVSGPKPASTSDIYTAKAFAAELALRFSKSGVALTSHQIAEAEKMFLEYKNK